MPGHSSASHQQNKYWVGQEKRLPYRPLVKPPAGGDDSKFFQKADDAPPYAGKREMCYWLIPGTVYPAAASINTSAQSFPHPLLGGVNVWMPQLSCSLNRYDAP